MNEIPAAWGAEPGSPTAWPTRLQELLLQAALIDDERALAAWRKVRPEVGPGKLDASVQVVLPHLRANLQRLGVEDELFGLFKGVHRYVWAQNQLLLARMMPLVAALEDAGIATLLLKGAGLVAGSHLDAGMRPMKDFDVLIPTRQARAAIDVPLGAGLKPILDVPLWWVTDYAPAYECGWAFEMIERGRSLRLDLHWHATYVSRQRDADDDFWDAARTVDLLGVRTRALDPTDELLVAIVHGMHWDPLPTYRWVVDSTLLARGDAGAIDFERLVEQARRRRVVAMVSAGLSYLHDVLSVPVPADALRALRRSLPRPLEWLELRALARAPQELRALDLAVLRHQHRARRDKPLGSRRLTRPAWSPAFTWRRPGPGRPLSLYIAPIGTGRLQPDVEPIAIGEPVPFSDPERVRRHFLYGAWFPQADGCMLAGYEARLVLPLARPADGALVLGISADAMLIPGRSRRHRLELTVNGFRVARFSLDAGHGRLEDQGIVLPRAAVSGRDVLELTLRMPDAVSPPAFSDHLDDRLMSILLRQLVVREPPVCELGQLLSLGIGSGDEALLAGGWWPPEPHGRWTRGGRAHLILRVGGKHPALALELDALPVRQHQRVHLSVNGGRAHRMTWEGSERRSVPLPPGAEELLVALRVKDPVSPTELGRWHDSRPVGLFVKSVGLTAN